MRLLAIFFPWASFFCIGRPGAAIGCLVLQLTLIGWLPAVLWAMFAISDYKLDKK